MRQDGGAMMRSSSKLITRARSVRNMGKMPFKFRFDFLIETVEKIAASGDVVVIWERNHKSDSTAPAKIDRTTRKANFGNEKISANITLFKMSPTDKKFLDKVVKIAVKANNVEGKTLGKIHLNLADYAEVPSGSKRIGAELSSGASLIATIQCTFISMGKVNRSKAGDLGLSECDEESDGGEDETDTDYDVSGLLWHKIPHKLTRTGSKKGLVRKEKHHHKDDDLGNGNCGDFERYRKENQRLRKQIEELEKSQHGAGRHGDLRALKEENQNLKEEIRELRSTLSREPVYYDVVRELKEAKLALALLQLERDGMQLELLKHQKGDASPNNVMNAVRTTACIRPLRWRRTLRQLSTKREEKESVPKEKLPTIQGDTEFVRRRRKHREIMHHTRIAFQEEVRSCKEKEDEEGKSRQQEVERTKLETRTRRMERSIERQKKVAELAKEIEMARKEKEKWSKEQWKKIVKERTAQKMSTLKMIEAQSHTWISKENLDKRLEEAVDAIMTPKVS